MTDDSLQTDGRADVVILGILRWDGRWQRPHHVARELAARGHRVVYISPHISASNVGWRRLQEPSCPPGVMVAELSFGSELSVHTSGQWDDLASAHALQSFMRLVKEAGLSRVILIVHTPGWWPLVEQINMACDFPIVYDCMDEHSAWDLDSSELLQMQEPEIVRRSSLVLATAKSLARKMEAWSWNVLTVPNGCDFEHFAKAANRTGKSPPGSPPVIGFVGAIGRNWFDVDLVVEAAELRRDWTFLLIGPAEPDIGSRLSEQPNIVVPGEVPWVELPRYLADFDVAILPMLVNRLTASTDPVKIYEYFAAGKPVVTTPLPELYPLQGHLLMAFGAHEFVHSIQRLLDEPGNAASRLALARRGSWGRRVDLFYREMLACSPSLDIVLVGAETRANYTPSLEFARVIGGDLPDAVEAGTGRYVAVCQTAAWNKTKILRLVDRLMESRGLALAFDAGDHSAAFRRSWLQAAGGWTEPSLAKGLHVLVRRLRRLGLGVIKVDEAA